MLSYALNPRHWLPTVTQYATQSTLVEALVQSYLSLTSSALKRGLLQGYVVIEDTLPAVRGRVRFEEQLRRQPALPLPVHVRYDEYTEDTIENRMLKAAAYVLRLMPQRSELSRSALRALLARFETVQLVRFDPRCLPDPGITRLNEHYAPALALARVILGNSSIELQRGRTRGAAVLFDMNKVF